jgi:cytochrome c peroxidase
MKRAIWFSTIGPGLAPNPNSDWTRFAPSAGGMFQVSSARNVAMTPPQCPTTKAGSTPYFQKGFFDNGYIKSLKQLVHACKTCNPASDPNRSPSRQGNGSLIPTPNFRSADRTFAAYRLYPVSPFDNRKKSMGAVCGPHAPVKV